ncbi:MAG: hypothetical protein L3J25_02120 [Flavobacteriaceae bacterium]|nr:hypothetical protein [Flavobacteriaceae bacterium]
MDNLLKLNNISFSDNGRKVNYDYSFDNKLKKYFNIDQPFYVKYDLDVSEVPKSILVIPFLSNMLTISWFAGFDIEVQEVDEDFYDAMKLVKIEFEKQFSEYELIGNLIAKQLVKNIINGNNNAMLFSGGIDAYATYIRIHNKIPDLVTILGADIEIDDQSQWNAFTDFIENEKLLQENKKQYIETNVRNFYTYQIELLLKDIGWWGKVQHGLSLIGSLAPISYINSYANIYIASSYTEHIDIAWGSTPQIDEKISWASIKVFHDGFELKRQDKVDLITKFSTDTDTNFKLRVCYSELREGFNCSNCEKCFRTILGIILSGRNPNAFGFKVKKEFYPEIFKILNSSSFSKGTQYFWWELMEKAKTTNEYFILEDKKYESSYLERIKNGELDLMFNKNLNKAKKIDTNKYKFILRNKFPLFFKLYKRIRY